MPQRLSRRAFVSHSATTAAALSICVSAQSVAEEKGQKKGKPNILLVFSDQQHWQAQGFMDATFKTPNQDALARESVVFERSFCTTPQCSPSRSSLLTGFYPSTTRVMGNVGAAGGNALTQSTIGKELQDAGYLTGYFGKWHLGSNKTATDGWDHQSFKINDPQAEKNAVQFLAETRKPGKPFALFVSLNNPHDIYHWKKYKSEGGDVPLPKSWTGETFDGKPPIQQQFMKEDQGKIIVGKPRDTWQTYRDCYRAKNKLYDDNLGAILAELKRQDELENTIIIVTSDHGDMDGQHKLIFKGPFMYEHMLRIPLMIRVPGTIADVKARRVNNADVVNVDIVPTIRELCGLPEKKSHGQSLVPLMTGAKTYKPREFVIGQYYSKQRWVNPIRTIRTGDYKLNRHIRWGDELYDLKKDPDELKNVAEDPAYTEIKGDLTAKLDQWMKDHEDPFLTLKPTTRGGKKLDV